MALEVDLEPVEIPVTDVDPKTGERTEYKVWIREFAESDVAVRMQTLSAPASSEDSRRGRQQRNQTQFHAERMRPFNFERGVVDWNFKYPETRWDPERKERVPHPHAGEPMPINRETYKIIPERIMDQIIDAINEINEPPQELPEVRDNEGGVLQVETHSPLELNSDDSATSG